MQHLQYTNRICSNFRDFNSFIWKKKVTLLLHIVFYLFLSWIFTVLNILSYKLIQVFLIKVIFILMLLILTLSGDWK